MVRHAPLSDGDSKHFGGLIQDPPAWKVKSAESSRPRRRRHHSSDDEELVPMRYDVEKGCLVPY